MGVNSLPKTVTRQRSDCDLKPGPSAPETSTLTTRLPSHPETVATQLVTYLRQWITCSHRSREVCVVGRLTNHWHCSQHQVSATFTATSTIHPLFSGRQPAQCSARSRDPLQRFRSARWAELGKLQSASPRRLSLFMCVLSATVCCKQKINLEDDSVLQEMDFLDLARYSSYIIGVKLTNL